ncbi:MAG: hypothetical protein KC431_17990 [Myxococcales bacterium]|nr:hypothetical protein [Myxococcales bacterium]
MSITRVKSSFFAAAALLAGGLLLTACPQGDVGAPCNHGTVEPPSSKLVTFPALSCSDLLCVYGEEQTVPETPCGSDQECNSQGGGGDIFECVNNSCRLSLDYVLERSMCSKTCSTDDDCNNTSLNNRPTVDDDETACSTGFSCTVLQRLGQFCCQRLCVCNDDLDTLDDLEQECEPNVGDAWIECYGNDQMTTG